MAVLLVATSAASQWTWQPIEVLSNRKRHSMALDQRSGRLLLFGGETIGYPLELNDTWQWDGSVWSALRPNTLPAERRGHAMAWDPVGQRILLFGGANHTNTFGETWAWNGRDWSLLQPAHQPPARWYHAMATDLGRQRIVLFGGAQGVTFASWGMLADTWEWDGTDWIQQFPAASPPAAIGHGMAWHAGTGLSVLFGGTDGGTHLPATTWVWDGAVWTSVAASAGSPAARYGAQLMEDPTRVGGVLMYGGIGTSAAVGFDEIWQWDGARWTQVPPVAVTPGNSLWAIAGPDPVRGQVVRHNGGPTWTWDGTQWSEHPTPLWYGGNVIAGGAAAAPLLTDGTWYVLQDRQYQVLRIAGPVPPMSIPMRGSAYHAAAGVVVLLTGGEGYASPAWAWDGTRWAQMAWPGESTAAIAYDSVRRKVVVFSANDTWEWDPQGWVRVPTVVSPPARTGAPMAFDPLRGRCVLFGGRNSSTSREMNDLWEWDGTNWTQRTAANMPGPRSRHVLVSFPALGGVLLIGSGQCGALLWDGVAWTQMPGPCLWTAGGLYDPERQRVLVQRDFTDPTFYHKRFFDLRAETLQSSPQDPRPGEAVTLQVNTPTAPNAPFLLALSGGTWPGIPYRDAYGMGNEIVPLNNDRILRISLGFGWWGVTNGAGAASLTFSLPNDPALVWSEFHAAGILFDTATPRIRAVTNNVRLRVIP